MADEKELNELRERIGRLSGRDQWQLLEWVFADHRRRCDEEEAAIKATQEDYLERVKTLLELERQRSVGGKRAAG